MDEDKINQIESQIIEIQEKIIRINNTMISKLNLNQLKNKNINFKGSITFDRPLKLNYEQLSTLEINNIGYTCSNNIEEDFIVNNDNIILLLSLHIPCCGVWYIKYRLEMNLTIGFSALKCSKIILNLNSEDSNLKQIILNINNINFLNQTLMTSSDSVITKIDQSTNVNIFVSFYYGKLLFPNAIFKIIKNDLFPILTATRIC